MNPITILSVAVLLAASAQGGTRVQRSPQGGWAAPAGSGWGSGTSIAEEGASEAIGIGGAIAEHEAVITIQGSADVPALLNIGTGSGVGLNQGAYNYQQSQINSDGSSNAYQGNSAQNSGYAYDYLGGDAQGLQVDVVSNGWSAVEGEGAVGQVDALAHTGPSSPSHGSGWRKP